MISVNLLPRNHTVAFRRARRVRIWTALCVIEAAGLGGAAWYLTPDAGAEQRAWSRFVGASDRLRAAKETLAAVAERETTLTRRAATARKLATVRVWSPLLAFLAARTPDEIMLTSLRARASAKAEAAKKPTERPAAASNRKPPPAEPDGTLVLTGQALDHMHLARFMRILNESSLFRTVRLDGAERKPFLAGEAVAFSLTCLW